MQKDGFPAAAILALCIFAVVLLIITMKLIYRQLDLLERRRSLSTHSNPPQIVDKLHSCIEEEKFSILLLRKSSKV
jgi:hypothetical protein